MRPFEFIVIGTPPSQQSRGKGPAAWKAKVAAAARAAWTGEAPTAAAVVFSATTYYTDTSPDVDNVLKQTRRTRSKASCTSTTSRSPTPCPAGGP